MDYTQKLKYHFRPEKGWMPSWSYSGYAKTDIGCMSLPRELISKDGRVNAHPN